MEFIPVWAIEPLRAVKRVLLSPFFYSTTFAILLLEWRFPLKPGQKPLRIGLLQDLVWLVLQTIFETTLIAAWFLMQKSFYDRHLSFLTITAVHALPGPVRFMTGLLAADFLDWLHHWVRHKVPWFWHFHAVHHSQRDMNLFTDLRYHAFEYLIARTINTIPLLMLQVNIYGFLTFALINKAYTRLYHAGIRSNFGPLRHILVTPQSHRIHHSIEPRDRDRNFGVIFSFWDRLFGTRSPIVDEYPETGVRDEGFPEDRKGFGWHLLWTPARQHLYPFAAIVRSFRR